jgi:hypothetical protein
MERKGQEVGENCRTMSPIPRRMRWAGHVAHVEMRNEHRILVTIPEEKNTFRRPKT